MYNLLLAAQSLPDVANGEGGSTLKNVIVLVCLLLVAFQWLRSRTSEVLRGELTAYREKAGRLEEEKKERDARLAERDKELAEFRAKTDLSVLMEQHRTFHVEMIGALTTVASASDGRYDRALAALEKNAQLGDQLIRRLDDQTSALQLITETLLGMKGGGPRDGEN